MTSSTTSMTSWRLLSLSRCTPPTPSISHSSSVYLTFNFFIVGSSSRHTVTASVTLPSTSPLSCTSSCLSPRHAAPRHLVPGLHTRVLGVLAAAAASQWPSAAPPVPFPFMHVRCPVPALHGGTVVGNHLQTCHFVHSPCIWNCLIGMKPNKKPPENGSKLHM